VGRLETRTSDGSAAPRVGQAGVARVTQRTGSAAVPGAAQPVTGSATAATPLVPRPAGANRPAPPPVGTYVSNSFTGDITMTSGGTPALAHDGEPAGLARITMAMRDNAKDASPAPRRLVGLACWAAALGILGAIVAFWDGIAYLGGVATWFVPTIGLIGLAGVGLTMGAFLTARVRMLPWVLLGLASGTLVAALVATSVGS
jgi:hypothetical protein